MGETVFDKIIRREISANIVFETDELIAFHDIHPLAPVHVLIIPKRHIATIDDLSDGDAGLVGRMIIAARDIARDLNISRKGYKLLFRVGSDGGQEIPHIHLHLIGGARLSEGICPVK
ncbi:MAG: histidine triad nucleotide-binding protein [Candidatus Moranbacteria bacterium]|nr:histidine triad nucleotide-binding protein [Candidatus Moranbacteria bacterium]